MKIPENMLTRRALLFRKLQEYGPSSSMKDIISLVSGDESLQTEMDLYLEGTISHLRNKILELQHLRNIAHDVSRGEMEMPGSFPSCSGRPLIEK
jgi:hypothetical protein